MIYDEEAEGGLEVEDNEDSVENAIYNLSAAGGGRGNGSATLSSVGIFMTPITINQPSDRGLPVWNLQRLFYFYKPLQRESYPDALRRIA